MIFREQKMLCCFPKQSICRFSPTCFVCLGDEHPTNFFVDFKLYYNYKLIMISFSWDSKKNIANTKKHGVSFDEAKTVFYDEGAIRYFDPDHSSDEDRFLMVGLSQKLRILVVCHCLKEDDSNIRIISARKATKGEEEEHWRERT